MKYPLYKRKANKGEWDLVQVFTTMRKLRIGVSHELGTPGGDTFAYGYRVQQEESQVYKHMPHYTQLVEPLLMGTEAQEGTHGPKKTG